MAREEGNSLGILLARGPGTPDADWAFGLARAAASRGLIARLFLMSDGAELLREPESLALDTPGVEVSACTRTVLDRGLPADVAGVDYASQFHLARIVALSDRFVSFC